MSNQRHKLDSAIGMIGTIADALMVFLGVMTLAAGIGLAVYASWDWIVANVHPVQVAVIAAIFAILKAIG